MTVYVKQAATTIAAMGLCSFLLLPVVFVVVAAVFVVVVLVVAVLCQTWTLFCFARICTIVHGSDNLTTHIRIYVGRIAISFDRTICGQK